MNIVIGADIGGSHMSAGLVDLSTRNLLDGTFLKCKIDASSSSEEILSSWSALLKELIASYKGKIEHIGLALPGPMDYQNGIMLIKDQKKFRSLYGINIKEALHKAINRFDLSILTENDALCFLRGEIFHRFIEENDSAIGLTLGTGFGSSSYVRGAYTDMKLWCMPFKNGIAEDYLSTGWFIEKYYRMTGKYIRGAKDLLEADKNPELVANIFEEFGDNLNSLLKSTMQNQEYGHVFLGGNISNAFELFSKQLTTTNAIIHRSELGERCAILGAASLYSISNYVKEI
ncbi:transcriptional regulator [Pedobacter yonginense]|uniref:Transcriptional regulator n=1 Tax=Pedobacter yonginense TaxID=651869 RepID=A0A317EJL0_9SPHI|nr:ROK family protein [Pedobacter yonginense]PWS26317.1 transcriptional regulator [Pedobacter yonginense]